MAHREHDQMTPPSPDPQRRVRFAIYTAVLCLALPAAVVPGFAWPWHRCGRRGADASAAIATLKNLHAAQEQLRTSVAIDQDGDGVGEYGFVAELAGAIAAVPLDPPMLSPAFGAVSRGRVQRSGYVFQVFLPGAAGGWLPESPDGGRGAQPVHADGAERAWLAYAWPQHAESGHHQPQRTFLIAADGVVRATAGIAEHYRGDFGPTAGLAGHRFEDGAWRLSGDHADARGNVWLTVR